MRGTRPGVGYDSSLVRVGSTPLSHVQDEPGRRGRVVTQSRPILSVIAAGLALLPPREAKRAAVLTVAIAAASALEITAVTAVLPFVNVVIQPTAIHTPGMLAQLHRLAGSPPEGEFIARLGFAVIALMVLA